MAERVREQPPPPPTDTKESCDTTGSYQLVPLMEVQIAEAEKALEDAAPKVSVTEGAHADLPSITSWRSAMRTDEAMGSPVLLRDGSPRGNRESMGSEASTIRGPGVSAPSPSRTPALRRAAAAGDILLSGRKAAGNTLGSREASSTPLPVKPEVSDQHMEEEAKTCTTATEQTFTIIIIVLGWVEWMGGS